MPPSPVLWENPPMNAPWLKLSITGADTAPKLVPDILITDI